MNEITRNAGESILAYYSRIKDEIASGSVDLDKSEIYYLLFGETVSSEHARKALRTLDLTLESDLLISGEKNIDAVENKVVVEIRKDGGQAISKLIKMSESDCKDPEFLLRAHGYNDDWELVKARSSMRNKGNDGLDLYSSSIDVKPKICGINQAKIKEWFDTFESKPVDAIEYNCPDEGKNCLVLPIADLHFNMLATEFISGNNYNKEIATENFYKIVNYTCDRVKDRNISEILLVLGNDMFNANGINKCTFRGTPQSEEGHIFEAFIQLSEITINVIEKLQNIAKVNVIFVPSNHDKEISQYYMFNLCTYFRLNPNVTIDCSPLPRKYYRFGKTLFMFAHDMKVVDVAKTMLDEAKEYLDGVEYHECILAHLHTESVYQDKNLTIRRLSTTSPNSTWANDSNYGANRVHQSFIYNDKDNITDCLYVKV